ncbi:YHS domain-containing (seleno)protein [Cognatishimia activa]|uniref:YHS domain protein n=1 Tax=Cognatishimia activa TaxID=1715691 RepID=A0A0P1IR27_9RHOB|nr:YHS domain-containing (seleno)protein [Cognatishimia activa]CUJ04788.1 YHS domain protein [Cognatishimia activa]CUK26062.1 YHS domain protein [Cognatishimia activa]
MNTLKSLIGGILLASSVAASAFAAGVEVNASNTGLALQGYDPVAYFTEGQATPGDYKITTVYNDTTYRFASEAHKATFEANPEAYLPQYGGYCAFGAAMGFKFDGDPELWKIVDGELFLNLAQDIQERWEGDIPGYIEKADAQWTEIADVAPATLQAQ